MVPHYLCSKQHCLSNYLCRLCSKQSFASLVFPISCVPNIICLAMYLSNIICVPPMVVFIILSAVVVFMFIRYGDLFRYGRFHVYPLWLFVVFQTTLSLQLVVSLVFQTIICVVCMSNYLCSKHHLPRYTILYYIILYYTILYYTILYYTILHYTIIYLSNIICVPPPQRSSAMVVLSAMVVFMFSRYGYLFPLWSFSCLSAMVICFRYGRFHVYPL